MGLALVLRAQRRTMSKPAEEGDDAPSMRAVAGHWAVGRIGRHEPDTAAGAPERRDGGLAVDQCGHYVAVVHIRLLAHHNPVPILDASSAHGVIGNLEQE